MPDVSMNYILKGIFFSFSLQTSERPKRLLAIFLTVIMKKHTKRFKSIHERKRGEEGSMNGWMENGSAMMIAG